MNRKSTFWRPMCIFGGWRSTESATACSADTLSGWRGYWEADDVRRVKQLLKTDIDLEIERDGPLEAPDPEQG